MRMPGTCSGCGERVELRIGEKDVGRGDKSYPGPHVFTMTTAWCEPGTDRVHRCDPAKRNAHLGVIR